MVSFLLPHSRTPGRKSTASEKLFRYADSPMEPHFFASPPLFGVAQKASCLGTSSWWGLQEGLRQAFDHLAESVDQAPASAGSTACGSGSTTSAIASASHHERRSATERHQHCPGGRADQAWADAAGRPARVSSSVEKTSRPSTRTRTPWRTSDPADEKTFRANRKAVGVLSTPSAVVPGGVHHWITGGRRKRHAPAAGHADRGLRQRARVGVVTLKPKTG